MAVPDVSDQSLQSLMSLAGRVAVVTGAARGLGAQIARRLLEAGATVYASDLDLSGVEALAATCNAAAETADSAVITARRKARTSKSSVDPALAAAVLEVAEGVAVAAWGAPDPATVAADAPSSTGAGLPAKVIAAHVDVASTPSLEALADRAIAECGRLDIWVNNAGIFPTTGPAIDATDEFIDRMLTVNTRGTFAGAREAAKRMTSGGVIINLASTAAFTASHGISAYVASKHAVVGITKALALEFGPRNIRVLAIAPTVIDTPGVQVELEPMKASGLDVVAKLANSPLGRMGVPDDIARVVVFAASDMAMYMTGSTIAVDAGRLI